MIKIIKDGHVYSPKYEGKKDILICNDKIAAIKDSIEITSKDVNIEIIDGREKFIFPGFIDSHVHILGGGGEGSFRTRTPELELRTVIEAGVTTLVGCLGTDGVARSLKSLIAKAKAFKEDGITCYAYVGSYEVPVRTLMGDIKEDIMMVEEFIGIGELAIADHRSTVPTVEELSRAAANSRVAGMLSGKCGIVNVHLGDSNEKLDLIYRVVEKSDIPITQFLPTHINRNEDLFVSSMDFIRKGGFIDLTTSTTPQCLEEGEVKCSVGLKRVLEEVGSVDNVTFSSDGQGSLPEFDEHGNLIRLNVGDSKSLYKEVKDAILEEGISIEEAIKVITLNPARALKLKSKGSLSIGKDADIVMVDKETLDIDTVISKGRIMASSGVVIAKDAFGR